jgi:hypothetical protein
MPIGNCTLYGISLYITYDHAVTIFSFSHHPQGILSSIYWTIRSHTGLRSLATLLMWWHHGRIIGNAFSTHGAFYARSLSRMDIVFMSTKIRKPSVAALFPSTKRTTADTSFPFAQYCCQPENENQLEFDFIVSYYFSQHTQCLISPTQSPFVWPARNKDGQDMMIKYATYSVAVAKSTRTYLGSSSPRPARQGLEKSEGTTTSMSMFRWMMSTWAILCW